MSCIQFLPRIWTLEENEVNIGIESLDDDDVGIVVGYNEIDGVEENDEMELELDHSRGLGGRVLVVAMMT
jgi:hypothetical protein